MGVHSQQLCSLADLQCLRRLRGRLLWVMHWSRELEGSLHGHLPAWPCCLKD